MAFLKTEWSNNVWKGTRQKSKQKQTSEKKIVKICLLEPSLELEDPFRERDHSKIWLNTQESWTLSAPLSQATLHHLAFQWLQRFSTADLFHSDREKVVYVGTIRRKYTRMTKYRQELRSSGPSELLDSGTKASQPQMSIKCKIHKFGRGQSPLTWRRPLLWLTDSEVWGHGGLFGDYEGNRRRWGSAKWCTKEGRRKNKGKKKAHS